MHRGRNGKLEAQIHSQVSVGQYISNYHDGRNVALRTLLDPQVTESVEYICTHRSFSQRVEALSSVWLRISRSGPFVACFRDCHFPPRWLKSGRRYLTRTHIMNSTE